MRQRSSEDIVYKMSKLRDEIICNSVGLLVLCHVQSVSRELESDINCKPTTTKNRELA